jgi:hypothetical protein
MGKVKQPRGNKGSLKWTQELINEYPSILNKQINKFFNRDSNLPIEWLSPRADDDYAEYRDEAFLDLVGIRLTKTKLKEFWPNGGPQWDALGRDSAIGPYFLVESKANISELLSECQAKAPASLSLIKNSLFETQKYLNCTSHIDWTKGFYQYANRVAHLYYLRCLNNVEAYLVFVYFLNDQTHIPTLKSEWDGAINLQKRLMGLSKHKLQENIIDVFIDLKDIKTKEYDPMGA